MYKMSVIDSRRNELQQARADLIGKRVEINAELSELDRIEQSIADLSEGGVISKEVTDIEADVVLAISTMEIIPALRMLVKKYGEVNRERIEELIIIISIYM